jgi:hypothetical protein
MSFAGKVQRKLTGLGVRLFFNLKRLVYRFHRPWRGKLSHFDHVTLPVSDLKVAEDFYEVFSGRKSCFVSTQLFCSESVGALTTSRTMQRPMCR